MSLGQFADAVSTRIWQSVAGLNWRSFEEAREFARGLELKDIEAWFEYAR